MRSCAAEGMVGVKVEELPSEEVRGLLVGTILVLSRWVAG